MLASYRIYKTDTITRAVLISHLWQNLILLYLQQKLSFPLCLSKKHSGKLLFYLSNSLTMKKISLATGVLLFCMAAFAQRGEPVDPQKDQKNFQGYLIKLLPAMGGTYGYAIMRGKELIALQNRNPFTNTVTY